MGAPGSRSRGMRRVEREVSDLMPTCPRCGELGAPLARVCDECGCYFHADDNLRDMQIRMAYARQSRHPQSYPQAVGSVDESLLDLAARAGVPSPVMQAEPQLEAAPAARERGK